MGGGESPTNLSERALADLAGVPVAFVRRAVELQLLRPGDGEASFRVADPSRVRLLLACDRAGLPPDAIAKAVREGRLSLAFMDLPQYRFALFTGQTYRELCAERGLDFDVLTRLHEAQGISIPGPDDPVREDDLEMVGALQMALLFGIPAEATVRMMRVYGESIRRMVDGESHVYRTHVEEPLLSAGMDVGAMLESASEFGAQYISVMDRGLISMYHRQQEHVWLANMVDRIEDALEEMGLLERLPRPPAMCFLDVVGYTRLTEERGDLAAAELAASLAGVVHGVSLHHGGRAVKWLGDGVMFYFPDPGRAVESALQMVRETASAGLPPAHVGLDAGPVVQQDGDYFGRTVNLASRIAGRAGQDEVLVSEDVVASAGQIDGVRFADAGTAELKNVAHPVRLWRATAP